MSSWILDNWARYVSNWNLYANESIKHVNYKIAEPNVNLLRKIIISILGIFELEQHFRFSLQSEHTWVSWVKHMDLKLWNSTATLEYWGFTHSWTHTNFVVQKFSTLFWNSHVRGTKRTLAKLQWNFCRTLQLSSMMIVLLKLPKDWTSWKLLIWFQCAIVTAWVYSSSQNIPIWLLTKQQLVDHLVWWTYVMFFIRWAASSKALLFRSSRLRMVFSTNQRMQLSTTFINYQVQSWNCSRYMISKMIWIIQNSIQYSTSCSKEML